jgi:hypothetical protein
MIWALGEASPRNRRNYERITVWLAAAGIVWMAGALFEGARLALWTAALAIEFASPALGFWVPGLGRSTTEEWDVAGGHLAERCALFIIIALGIAPRHRGDVRGPHLDGRSRNGIRRCFCQQHRHVVDLFRHRRRTGHPQDRECV